MKLQIRNCVTDPSKKALRRRGQGVLRPVIMGKVLVPGAIRVVSATDMQRSDVDLLDSLIKNHSCTALHIGVGNLSSCETVYEFLGFNVEQETVEVVEPIAEEAPEQIEAAVEPVEQQAEVVEEAEETVEVVEEEASEETAGYTKTELMNKKNAELREICTLLVEDVDTNGMTKKKLVALILENQ